MDNEQTELKLKSFLSTLASRLRPQLRKLKSVQALKGSLDGTDTDGWKIKLARSSDTWLELWLDEYARKPENILWYGYYWSGKRSFGHMVSGWCAYIPPSHLKYGKDATYRPPYHFRKALKQADFKLPFLENYASPAQRFFGRFDSRKRVSQALVRTIVDFYRRSLTPNGRVRAHVFYAQRKKEVEAEEGERLRKALQHDRKSSLAARRKFLDHYICQICRFDFSKAYPSIGEEFAESHHIISFRKKKGRRKTRLSDLITLCANCHRMVHKAETLKCKNPMKSVRVAVTRGRR